jgi:hypothetical protein
MSRLFLSSNFVLFFAIEVVVFIMIIIIAQVRNDIFLSLNKRLFDGISRGNYRLMFALFKVFLKQHPDATKTITVKQCNTLSMRTTEEMTDYNKVIQGSSAGIVDWCYGRNERLDYMHFADDCQSRIR